MIKKVLIIRKGRILDTRADLLRSSSCSNKKLAQNRNKLQVQTEKETRKSAAKGEGKGFSAPATAPGATTSMQIMLNIFWVIEYSFPMKYLQFGFRMRNKLVF